MIGLLDAGLNVQKEDLANDKYVKVLEGFTKHFSKCSVKHSLNKEPIPMNFRRQKIEPIKSACLSDDLILITLSANKNMPGSRSKTRAIPKNLGIGELTSYLLATGDLPTPSQAEKLIKLDRDNDCLGNGDRL